MEGIQGAVLGVKLKHLAAWTEARREHAKRYDGLLKGLPSLVTPEEMPYAKHVYHLYVVRTPHRDRMQKHLEGKGIGTGLHYPVPLHLQKVFTRWGYTRGDFPVTEQLASECLSLPMYPELTEDQIDYVCSAIRGFYD
jgi:dTDP-4-amino-4,6-dideoxygalactose transaminase